jgi:hypothetical protein
VFILHPFTIPLLAYRYQSDYVCTIIPLRGFVIDPDQWRNFFKGSSLSVLL